MPGEELKKGTSMGSMSRLSGQGTNLVRTLSKTLTGSRANLQAGTQMDQATMISQALESGQRVYENTYKMKPDRKFKSDPVRRMVEDVLAKNLKDVQYSGDKVPELTKQITNEILAGVKQFNFDRYKFVVDVTICEAKNQGIRVASRCLWDTKTDSCASASFKNSSVFAVGIVFGCFFE